MRKMLEHLVNVVQKKDLELLFGTNSKIIVESINYSTNKKTYVIHTKILATEIDDSVDVFPEGINILMENGWKFTGIDEKITLVNKLDLL